MDSERGSDEEPGWLRGLSSSYIERLLAIYAATGEGQGAYIAAKTSEEARGSNSLRLRRLITGTSPLMPNFDGINTAPREIG
jgi:hypothetical protein